MRTNAGRVLRIMGLTVIEAFIVFAVFRAVLATILFQDIVNAGATTILAAFFHGLPSDIVVVSALLFIPLSFAIIGSIGGFVTKVIQRALQGYTIIVVPITLFILAADIPFFQHYNSHISVHALHWTSSPEFMLGLVFGELLHVGLLATVAVGCIFWCRRILRRLTHCTAPLSRRGAFILVWLLPLFLLAIRGRTSSKATMQIGTTFFSGHHLVDLLTLNPVHVMALSMQDRSVAALKKKYDMDPVSYSELNRANISTPFRYTSTVGIDRRVTQGQKEPSMNVVLILGESLGANKSGLLNAHRNHTPVLDSLARSGVLFTQCYSDGIHTFNGVYSSLTGLPSPPGVQTLRSTAFVQASFSLPAELASNGYETYFFTTHDIEFDNMAGFARTNGVEHIIGSVDFPSGSELSVTGVPDHMLFNKVTEILAQVKSPFFACVLTGSDHGPWVIPDELQNNRGTDKQENAARYADHSLGRFIRSMRKAGLYDNTLFVITGDHGVIVDNEENKYVATHHVPLLFLNPPSTEQVGTRSALSGQIDIAPTILGAVGISYTNRSLGIDLFSEKRHTLPATYDDELLTFMKGSFCVDRANPPFCFQANEEKVMYVPLDVPETDPREVTRAAVSLILDKTTSP